MEWRRAKLFANFDAQASAWTRFAWRLYGLASWQVVSKMLIHVFPHSWEAKAAWSLEFEADAVAAQSECRFLQALCC